MKRMMAVAGGVVALLVMMILPEKSVGQAVPVTPGAEEKLAATRNACSEKDVAHYTARRATVGLFQATVARRCEVCLCSRRTGASSSFPRHPP